MKKKSLIALLITIILLIGGGVVVWKLSSSKEKATSSSNQQKDNNPTPTPLNKLSDQELEKCLLEDFSRRLDLEKYFVFGLGKELENEKFVSSNTSPTITMDNCHKVKPLLSQHLTKLTKKSHGREKWYIAFCGKDYDTPPPNDWNEKELTKKINNGEDWFIFFDKNRIKDSNFFSESIGISNVSFYSVVGIAIENPLVQVKKNKSEALELIKTDPAILGEN